MAVHVQQMDLLSNMLLQRTQAAQAPDGDNDAILASTL
jgi:hypothetical protein